MTLLLIKQWDIFGKLLNVILSVPQFLSRNFFVRKLKKMYIVFNIVWSIILGLLYSYFTQT